MASNSRLTSPVAALRARLRRLSERLDSVHGHTTATRLELAEHREQIRARLDKLEAALRPINDRGPWQRERLRELRRRPGYEHAFTVPDPLVSIVIPTYRNYEMLRERALPSALAQTHANVEVIVVGDQAPPQTGEVVEAFGDERLRYFNRPLRGPYPEDPERRWYVAGVPPYNDAVALAKGEWIAPLDDDDAFTPDHVERLVEFTRAERAELSYAAIRQHRPGGVTDRIGSFPPQWSEFNLQACIYHAGLAEIFDLELADWVFEEPYDWSLIRRMLQAGVRCAYLDEELVEYWPARYWDPGEPEKREPSERLGPRAEWELAPDGFGDEDEGPGEGWDVEAVAAAYREKWPQFLAAIDGPGPLGVAHEVPAGVKVSREDPIAHNIVHSFGHALGQAAHGRERISVLDWGGAVGHYHELAKRLWDDVELDWHVRELPAVCAIGRELSPAITFHDSDDCLERSYDLVLVSASFQYARDWRSLLGRLAGAADQHVFITRMPVIESHPSYVVLQRAQTYGYETEYRGWVLHRGELVQAAEAEGLELVREYALVDPINIVDAPENPKHIGLLLRAGGSG